MSIFLALAVACCLQCVLGFVFLNIELLILLFSFASLEYDVSNFRVSTLNIVAGIPLQR